MHSGLCSECEVELCCWPEQRQAWLLFCGSMPEVISQWAGQRGRDAGVGGGQGWWLQGVGSEGVGEGDGAGWVREGGRLEMLDSVRPGCLKR